MNPIIIYRVSLFFIKTRITQTLVLFKLGLIALFSCLLFACTVKQVPVKAAPVKQAKPVSSPEIGSIDVSMIFPELSDSERHNYQNEISKFYQLAQNKPIWIHQAKLIPQAESAIKILEQALSDGLNPMDYDAKKLRQYWLKLNVFDLIPEQQQIEFDITLSANFIRYLFELHHGRIDAKSLNFDFETEDKWHHSHGAHFLFKAVQHDKLDELVKRMEPDLALYHDLKKTLAKYRELHGTLEFSRFSITKAIKPGDINEQLGKIKTLLAAVGDYHSQENEQFLSEIENNRYDENLLSAVKMFQQRHGFDSDGIIGKKTLAALNTPLEHRVKQLELAMERLRWLPNLSVNRFIMVNIPTFQLWGFDTDAVQENYSLKMNVVVGEALDKQTPVFMANMKYLDFRPYWNIPYSIAVKELLPDMMADPETYLAEHNMEFVQKFNDQSSAVEFNKESLDLLRKGEIKLRQRPGKGNALGKVKFIFPNRKAVYLHDTPSQRLFKRSRRDFSHGCIRVEDPESLALFALNTQVGWDRKVIRKAMNSGKSQRVYLSNYIPVIIFYTTALAEPDGTISFFDDIYGHDQRLSNALAERTLAKKIQISHKEQPIQAELFNLKTE